MGQIYWAKASFLNFGDDMNLWLWPRLFPEFFNRDDEDTVVGIGTILSTNLPINGRLFIMGSGAGYAPLPPTDQRMNWNTIFVRGPLTARVLNLPKEKAITDGAFLAADLFRRPKVVPSGAIFIPHWKSDIFGDWAAVCGYAGLRHVSPMQPIDTVLSEIAASELVVTESMHGAILADALRVPWIAVRTSPEINDFKWIDWCLSVGETYAPHHIPPSGIYDAHRQGKADAILSDEAFTVDIGDDPEIIEDVLTSKFRERFEGERSSQNKVLKGKKGPYARLLATGKEDLTRYIFRKALLKPSFSKKDTALKERAAIALSAAVGSKWRLSSDQTHNVLMDRLRAASEDFRVQTKSFE